jgi:filamentous hemagglutinin family protein
MLHRNSVRTYALLLGLNIYTILHTQPSFAQIIPDKTLPNPSTVTPTGTTRIIEGGTVAGPNLFHSFSEFSVSTGTEAFFNNNLTIQNILTRVTGSKISEIDGLIRANGNANLFLINPNGIMFGPNASLNIGGSFIGSTANQIQFADGTNFSATQPKTSPLLTVSVPMGLQFNNNIGSIQLQGNGHNLSLLNPLFPQVVGAGLSQSGLRVQPGKTLALVGGEIIAKGGSLTASGGQIELGSVQNGFVTLKNGLTFNYENVQNFGNITLANQSALDASGTGTGSIQVQAHQLKLTDGSTILIQNQGLLPAGNIHIKTTNSVELTGTTPTASLYSSILNQSVGLGDGGNIDISTKQLILQDGAQIDTRPLIAGQGGNITVQAEDVQILKTSPLNPLLISNISALAFNAGHAGNVNVSTNRLIAKDGGALSSITFGSGNGGNVSVQATDSIEISGVEPTIVNPSAMTAGTFNTGNSGNLTVNTSRLIVSNSARVGASTVSFGNAGNVTINASESVEVIGQLPGVQNPSLIDSSANILDEITRQTFGLPDVPTGNSGNVTITTPQLKVSNAGLVNVRNDGPGNPGTLSINADSILLNNLGGITAVTTSGSGGDIELKTRSVQLNNGLINASVFGSGVGGNITIEAPESVQVRGQGETYLQQNVVFPALAGTLTLSDLKAGIITGTDGSGAAGTIKINTGTLQLSEGALITTSTLGEGPAGNILINSSDSVEIKSSVLASGTFSRGVGGNIEVQTPTLKVSGGGQLTSNTFGAGKGGNINVQASQGIELSGTSQEGRNLFASGFSAGAQPNTTGSSGNITINTPNLTIQEGAEISVSSLGTGNPGNIDAKVGSIFLNNGTITGTSLLGTGGNINLQVDSNLILRNNSEISTQAGTPTTGGGNGGNITLSPQILTLLENSTINANAFEGAGGNISITTQGVFVAPPSTITASSQLGVDGVVEIRQPEVDPASGLVELSNQPVDPDTQIVTGCSVSSGSEFIVTGRGGIPEDPFQPLRGQVLWQDLRLNAEPTVSSTSDSKLQATYTTEQLSTHTQKQLTEATAWVKDQQGRLELIATIPHPIVLTPYPCLNAK